MSETLFTELNLVEPILSALKEEGYEKPTPIQAGAIPHLLEGGDLLGCAQTGTGKTAAFALPMIQRLISEGKRANKKRARALVLTPTRELALQIFESFQSYGRHTNLRTAVIYGGVGHVPQIKAVSQGVDVLIATPGRLLDLLNQQHVRLDAIEILTLDEADRMLDMGFIRDVRKILALVPSKRQTLFFSATMPNEVASLADTILSNPKKIKVDPVSSTADMIDDHVLFVERNNKRDLLLEVLSKKEMNKVLVFTRTKHRANRLAEFFTKKRIPAEAIHGNKSQNARQRALKEFTDGKVKVLIATDIVARGIDVEGISHVINFELPNEPESYVHRIGRTARAGTSGTAISFCDRDETGDLCAIEKVLKRKIEVDTEHEFHAAHIEKLRDQTGPSSRTSRGRTRGGNSQGRRSAGGGNGNRRGGQGRGSQKRNPANRGQGAKSGAPNRRRSSSNRSSGQQQANA
jgi:ATP-dependent RNA helicase RhlE